MEIKEQVIYGVEEIVYGVIELEPIKCVVDGLTVETGYFISNRSRVWSERGKKGKWLKINTSRGYGTVSISLIKFGLKAKTCSIHRLVAKYFLPNPLNLPMVHHIDSQKLNNHVKNLMWVTYKENSRLASWNDEINSQIDLEGLQQLNLDRLVNKLSDVDLAKKNKVDVSMIKNILKGRSRSFCFSKIIKKELKDGITKNGKELDDVDTVLTSY